VLSKAKVTATEKFQAVHVLGQGMAGRESQTLQIWGKKGGLGEVKEAPEENWFS